MDKPNIVVCLPGPAFSQKFLKSWTDLYPHLLMNFGNVHVMFSSSSLVSTVRHKCLGASGDCGVDFRPFNGEIDYDYILWIDSDMEFSPEAFDLLYSRDLPIVGCAYPKGPDEKGNLSTYTAAIFGIDGEPHDLCILPKSVSEVAYIGFGFLLMKREAIEKIPYPWFDHITLHTPWTIRGETQIGEDVSFCNKANNAGVPIYVDPFASRHVFHEKPMSLGVADMERQYGV